MTLASLILVQSMILQRWHLFVNDMVWGTEKYIVILKKHFQSRTVHGVQRNVLQSLQRHFPSIFWPLYLNTSHNNQNLMASYKHFVGYSLYIWQLCDLGFLDHHKIWWFCSFVIWAFLAHVRFAKVALVCEHHDMGYREVGCNLNKSMSHQSFFQNNSHNSLVW